MSIKKKSNKIIEIISNAIQIILIVLLFVVCLFAFGAKIPFLASKGLSFYAVTSGSMEPTIPTGSIIKVGQYKLDELKVDDIITYQVVDESSKNVNVVTHRINQLEKNEEKKLIGKGDLQTEKLWDVWRLRQ